MRINFYYLEKCKHLYFIDHTFKIYIKNRRDSLYDNYGL